MSNETAAASRRTEAHRAYREGRFHDLKRVCAKVLGTSPGDVEFLSLHALASARTGDLGKAEQSLRKAIAILPNEAILHSNLGNVLKDRGRIADSIERYEHAIRLRPEHADAHYNLGLALARIGRFEESIASYERAIAINPRFADAHYNLGGALRATGRHQEAMAALEQAIRYNPLLADAHNNLGVLLLRRQEFQQAVACLQTAAQLRPRWAEAQANLGTALLECGDLPCAATSFRAALEADPKHHLGRWGAINCAKLMCDWGPELAHNLEFLKNNLDMAVPHGLLGIVEDPADLQRVSISYTRSRAKVTDEPLWRGDIYDHGKIRLAYLSADFRNHATAALATELFEIHDRGAFEVHGVSFGPDDGSAQRIRLQRAFDTFTDVRDWSEARIAAWLRAQEIDIAIDLMGHTRYSKPRILARRPAPIQVNYLGFPGTMGAEFIDYILADETVIPVEQRRFYTEQVAYLPDTYQVNDRRRLVAAEVPTRAHAGLPEQAFVFCSFNNNWKITPEFFSLWMRLLHAVPGSVLWLLKDNPWAVDSLHREAAARGIEPQRLVFAERADNAEHLARHQLADLFLDTLPCGAHTTASDALWAGLPVLTCEGRSFAGRVAASLVRAARLSGLVVSSVEEYEQRALELARDLAQVAGLKAVLASSRLTCPLFDTGRFRRHIEAAYRTMWGRYRAGQPPSGFRVTPVD